MATVSLQHVSLTVQLVHGDLYTTKPLNVNVYRFVVWRFGAVSSDVGQINEVTLRRARLVLGWVTVWGFNSVREIYLRITNHPGQLSLAILPWVGAMSTGQRAVMLCDWE